MNIQTQGKYLCSLHKQLDTEDVQLRTRLFSIGRSAPRRFRRWGGQRITNIVGLFTSGKTVLMEALIRYFQANGLKVGCLPETTVGEPRPWETQGEFVHRVTAEEFERRYKAEDFLVAYARHRGKSGIVKTGGISVSLLKERMEQYDHLLMTVNVVAQLELEEIFVPPIPAIVVVTSQEDHAAMQRFRKAHPLDSAGLSGYGVQSQTERISGLLAWQNRLIPGLENLSEVARRKVVIQRLIERFEDPLSDFELAYFPGCLQLAHLPDTIGEYLKQIVIRDPLVY